MWVAKSASTYSLPVDQGAKDEIEKRNRQRKSKKRQLAVGRKRQRQRQRPWAVRLISGSI
jgi:hypothetical protein